MANRRDSNNHLVILNFIVMKNLELMKQFEVEELEERLEFAKWSAEASGSCKDGSYEIKGTIKCEF